MLKKIVILALVYSWSNIGLTQASIVQLQEQLATASADTTRILTYIDLGVAYANSRKVDSAILVLNKGLTLAEAIDDKYYTIRTLSDLGLHSINQGNPKAGRDYLQRALLYLNDFPEKLRLRADVYNNIATSFRRLGQIDSSFYYYTEGSQLYESLDYDSGVWRCQMGLTRLFMENKNFQKAIEHVEKAMALVDRSNRVDYGFSLYFQNLAYLYGGEMEKYAQNFEDWRAFKNKGSGAIEEDARHAGLVNIFGDDLNESASAVEKAVVYSKARKNKLMVGLHLQTLGDIYSKLNQPEKAIDNLLKSIPYFQDTGSRYAREEVYFSLYEAYKNQDSLANATRYLEQYVALKDEIASDQMQRNISELEIRYETEKKDQTILQQTRERNLLLISGALLLIAGIAVILFLRNRLRLNKQIAEREAEIQSQKITQLEQEKKIATYDAMIQGQEQERQRVARDLHDSIGGLLSTVKAHYNSVQLAGTNGKEPDHRFAKANTLLDEACEEVRRISHNMMPRALELSGIELAVEDLRDGLQNKGIACHLEIIGNKPLFDKNKETMIFRILQELCNNITKHAGAKQVLLQLLWTNDQLNILVEDDGKGFDIDSLVGNEGIGLKSIRSRVKFLNGKIHFDSVLHEGTTVNLEIPLL
jgi:signal transduction histidine kinase